MRTLKAKLYQIALACVAVAGLTAFALGLSGVITGIPAFTASAVAVLGLGTAALAVATHMLLRRVLRAVRDVRAAIQSPVVIETSGVPKETVLAIADDLRQLRRGLRLTMNNELHLLDAVQQLRAADDVAKPR